MYAVMSLADKAKFCRIQSVSYSRLFIVNAPSLINITWLFVMFRLLNDDVEVVEHDDRNIYL